MEPYSYFPAQEVSDIVYSILSCRVLHTNIFSQPNTCLPSPNKRPIIKMVRGSITYMNSDSYFYSLSNHILLIVPPHKLGGGRRNENVLPIAWRKNTFEEKGQNNAKKVMWFVSSNGTQQLNQKNWHTALYQGFWYSNMEVHHFLLWRKYTFEKEDERLSTESDVYSVRTIE